MVLLLIIYQDYNVAVDMRHVARIADTRKLEIEPDAWLLEPHLAKTTVVLKNRYLIPAHQVVKITSDQIAIQTINAFLDGCMKRKIFTGFAIVQNRIYPVLDINALTPNITQDSTPDRTNDREE